MGNGDAFRRRAVNLTDENPDDSQGAGHVPDLKGLRGTGTPLPDVRAHLPAGATFFQKTNEEERKDKLVWIHLESFENRAAEERLAIASFMTWQKKAGNFSEGLASSYCPNARIVRKWFCEESHIFAQRRRQTAIYPRAPETLLRQAGFVPPFGSFPRHRTVLPG